MIALRRRCHCHCFPSVWFLSLVFLLIGYHIIALKPALNHVSRTQRTMHFYDSRKMGGLSSTHRLTHKIRGTSHSGTTRISLTGDGAGFDIESTASSWIHGNSGILLSFDGPDLGGLAIRILGLGLVASVLAFVYANVVYTPEILEGYRDIKRSERESEIRKLLEAVQSHVNDGTKESTSILELRVPLETALGKTLEDYVRAVLEPGSESNDALFTAADMELASILKQSI